jgi:predicted Zn-dependent protease
MARAGYDPRQASTLWVRMAKSSGQGPEFMSTHPDPLRRSRDLDSQMEEFNKEYFTKINIEQTNSINLGAKKVKILTNHPKSSYKLVGEKPVEKLEITNAQDFWSTSKYLVIVIE